MIAKRLTYQPLSSSDQPLWVDLPLSKSIAARHLILTSICQQDQFIPEVSSSEDTPQDLLALSNALDAFVSGETAINVRESGTAMRLMLAYIAARAKQAIRLSGTARQHDRPISSLVDALKLLGADIQYLEKDGYPPLLIYPSELKGSSIVVDASKSSQYLSALLLIAPLLKSSSFKIRPLNGLIASKPYALITIAVMKEYGFIWEEQADLFVYRGQTSTNRGQSINIERDWSAASYWYMLQVLHPENKILLGGISLTSLQGDSTLLIKLYQTLGVISKEIPQGIELIPGKQVDRSIIEINCNEQPDLVPTLVATLIALEQAFRIKGITHLRLKESDRIQALATELRKIGVQLQTEQDTIAWDGTQQIMSTKAPVTLKSYRDHRVVMALAPLMAKYSPYGVLIDDVECVSKSYPAYWRELTKLGYNLN